MSSTPSKVSTGALARALILALDEHDDIAQSLQHEAAKAFKAIAENDDPTRIEYNTMKTNLEHVLARLSRANADYMRLEDVCMRRSLDVSLDEPWTPFPQDLRDMLAGHLEIVAMEGATELLAEAQQNPTQGAQILKAGLTGTTLFLLTGVFPAEKVS